MTQTANAGPGVTLTLSGEERDQLLNLLEQTLRVTLVEEHRTDAFDYKEYVRQKEVVLKGMIDKLRRT